jgi:predicted transcriptional regulator
VIEKGLSQYAAAKEVGIDKAAVCRALGKLTEVTTCPCCGHTKREIKQ